ncbi:sulfonate ABC transporter substrate-binding protein [Longimycelium tulufanense]|uniref:Sulfonate ABC transporter substrate-binding protein n=1 Tax=Longimycelium tulufanense TaxID=907463 RepID=A0A8J3C924_9PSEU|nr:ABC transporter substrate-binding protein [Longimycelium tulufanense]GGM43573.1 sulfonate ABC transporter substrate-binding protein [Longimycelium tulufanense]
MARRDGFPGRRTRYLRRALAVTSAALLAITVSGCSLLGGSNGADGGNDKVEKAKITVGLITKAIDVAPVHLALKEGYFKDEGLDVELRTIQGGADAVPGLASGSLDIAFGNWISFFAAQAKGTLDLRVVSDGYQAKPGMFMVLARPDSGIKGPADLKGKTVAVNTTGNVNELTLKSVLQANNVDTDSIKFATMPFPDMPANLQNKNVDAASVIEPFATLAQNKFGALPVLDSMQGPTADLPIAGYVATKKFAEQNPRTVAAFQRAMKKAQGECSADRKKVENLLVDYAGISAEIAPLVHLGTFPTTLEATRLQRVADLMKTFGVVNSRLDVKPLLLHLPQN